jgi:UDP-N-acetylglucosamine 2-epimerase (non-hydrolysing)
LKILNIVGARPNFMKIAPVQKEMQKYTTLQPILVHTGQHYDDKMSKFFFEDLELPKPDIYLGVGSGSHAQQTAKIMIEFEKVVISEKPDLVTVVGDVNSTAACSLVASKMGVSVAHIEAGLRSFDRSMPEEINRIITDTLSDYLFVTEKSGLENLKREGISDSKVFFVGNVMIDSLTYFMEKSKNSIIINQLNLNGSPYVLMTLHRPSNVDVKENFENLIEALAVISKYIKIIFPIHPRATKMLSYFKLTERVNLLEDLITIEPLGYLDFMHLMQNAKFILTDSGGIQEESTYLGIPCLTLRENTERPITIEMGTNILVGSDRDQIISESQKIFNGEEKKGKIPPKWDGKAAQRIVKVLLQ